MNIDSFFRHNIWVLPVLGISIGVGIHFIRSALKTAMPKGKPPELGLDNEYVFIELTAGPNANLLDLAALAVPVYEQLRRAVVEAHAGSDDRAFVDDYLTKIDADPSALSFGGGGGAKLRFTLPPDESGKNHRDKSRVALLLSAAKQSDQINHYLRTTGYEIHDETLTRLAGLAAG